MMQILVSSSVLLKIECLDFIYIFQKEIRSVVSLQVFLICKKKLMPFGYENFKNILSNLYYCKDKKKCFFLL